VAAERSADQLLALDQAHVWHPYAAMPATVPAALVNSASGVRLRIASPQAGSDPASTSEVIDAMSSWWAACWGYRHPVLDAAAHAQIDSMSHVMFGGLTHRPAIELVERLVALAPAGIEHVFLADSGSVAVEVATKMALQYWHGLGQPLKRRLLTWRGGYHGDTLHPMSVCDPDGGMHATWTGTLPEQVFADAPPPGFAAPLEETYVAHLRSVIESHLKELAAIIIEPVVQGAGGMTFHSPEYLRVWRGLADEYDLLLIFDEIATGFGRTGEIFAADHAGVTPDIMCVGKAMTGGYLTMAAAMCTPRVSATIAQGDLPVLAHGPTFMGNPLAAAVANASIGLLDSTPWRTWVPRIERELVEGLEGLRDHPAVADVRVLGAIGVCELREPVDMAAATRAALDSGVWLRPFGRLVYTMPPYISTTEEVAAICAAIAAVADTNR